MDGKLGEEDQEEKELAQDEAHAFVFWFIKMRMRLGNLRCVWFDGKGMERLMMERKLAQNFYFLCLVVFLKRREKNKSIMNNNDQ